jgi:phospholipid/cholesterol/gamma-HCH transport system substrate-binding protein
MVTQAPKRVAVLAAIAFALSCIGLIVFVWTQFGGTIPFAPQGYQARAVFPETGLLVPGADVRIAGVNVGRVTAIAPRGVNSLVTMDISQQYAPIPADTRAILRLKTLLGEGYVELSSGNRSGPKLPDGGTIPRAQVGQTQQLDQVLSAFGRPAQRNLQLLLDGSAAAAAGHAADISNAIGSLDPALSQLQQIVGTLDAEQGDVQGLLRGSAIVLSTLGQRSTDLQSLITAGDQVLSATSARDAQLRATVGELPGFLAQLRSTLSLTGTTLKLAKPSLDALQPATPLLAPVLRDVIALSGPAVALLHQAPRLLHDAKVALPAVARFNRAFHPALDALLPAVKQVVPMIDFIGMYKNELVNAMVNLAASLEATAPAQTPGGTAHYLRAMSVVSNESFFGHSIREPGNRDNTYFSPGELAYVAKGGLLSASCANTTNPSQSPLGLGNVPCRVQPGFRWAGLTRYFPHVTAGSKR